MGTEKRYDAGRGPFSLREFLVFHGRAAVVQRWAEAAGSETRMDGDKGPFTLQQYFDDLHLLLLYRNMQWCAAIVIGYVYCRRWHFVQDLHHQLFVPTCSCTTQ